jgi:ketosteroid isomerase-like protein
MNRPNKRKSKVSEEGMRRSAVPPAEGQANAKAEIRRLINDRIDAVRAKDVNRATSSVAHDVMAFDVVDAFQQAGIEAMRERAASWFSSFENAIGVEVRDLTVCVSGDTAFAHSLNRYFGKLKRGGTIDVCVRVTLCLRRIKGQWLITHEHNSVPFNSKSGTAMI